MSLKIKPIVFKKINIFSIGIGVGAVFFLSIFFLYHYNNHGKGNVVIYDGENFMPAHVVIQKGERITFLNKSKNFFWPASDLHPSHTVYPDFDSKKPIAPNESWQFTFTNEGTWGMHDHLRSTATGSIQVGTVEKNKWRDNNCDAPECWEETVINTLKTEGVESSFNIFAELYEQDPAFQSVCHSIAHSIGEEAYKLFIEEENFSLSQKTSYCGYGFYHGFMETLLVETGDIRLARNFCSYVDDQLAIHGPSSGMACYHGVGHGFTDGSDPRTWGDESAVVKKALEMCTIIADTEQKKYLCGTGVFNGLAIARQEGDYGLSSATTSIFSPCKKEQDSQFKLGCYEQMNTLLSATTNNDTVQLFSILKSIPDPEYLGLTLQSVMGVLISESSGVDAQIDLTGKCIDYFPNESHMCLGGGVSGILEFGTPGKEHIETQEYCSAEDFTVSEQVDCLGILMGFLNMDRETKIMLDICNTLSERYKKEEIPYCREY